MSKSKPEPQRVIKLGELLTLDAMPVSDILERLIDRHGLYRVTEAIEGICDAKAEHLEYDWQDVPAAKRWTRARAAFSRVHAKLKTIQLP